MSQFVAVFLSWFRSPPLIVAFVRALFQIGSVGECLEVGLQRRSRTKSLDSNKTLSN